MIATALASVTVLAAVGEHVKQVNSKQVCFITKKRFDRNLKAVNVEGKTYYACCDDCVAKLTSDPKSRMDVDPVSGKEVDKATAFIGMDKAGNIYFFQSLENLKKFRVPAVAPTGE